MSVRALSAVLRLSTAVSLAGFASCAQVDDSPSGEDAAIVPSYGDAAYTGYPAAGGGSTYPASGGYDAGYTAPSSGGAQTTDAGMWSLGLNDAFGDGGLFGGGGAKGDASTASGDGSVDACKDAICFDVFDCYIFHPDKTSCGFTACDGFVCK